MLLWAYFLLQNLCFVQGNFWNFIPFLKLISFIYSWNARISAMSNKIRWNHLGHQNFGRLSGVFWSTCSCCCWLCSNCRWPVLSNPCLQLCPLSPFDMDLCDAGEPAASPKDEVSWWRGKYFYKDSHVVSSLCREQCGIAILVMLQCIISKMKIWELEENKGEQPTLCPAPARAELVGCVVVILYRLEVAQAP